MSDLSSAKVGDKLFIKGEFGSDRIVSIERITKTMVIAGDKRLNMSGGGIGETGWSRTYARIATDSDFREQRIRSAKRKLTVLVVTPENLELVESMLLACAEAKEPS